MVPNTSQEHFCGCLEHGQAVYDDNSGQWTISAAGRPQTRPHSFRHPSKTTRDKARPLSLAICGFLFSCKKSTTYLTFDPPTRTLRSLKFSPLLLGNVFSSMAALSKFARKTYNPRHEPPVTPSPKQLLVRLVRDILAHTTGHCICSVHVRFTTERNKLIPGVQKLSFWPKVAAYVALQVLPSILPTYVLQRFVRITPNKKNKTKTIRASNQSMWKVHFTTVPRLTAPPPLFLFLPDSFPVLCMSLTSLGFFENMDLHRKFIRQIWWQHRGARAVDSFAATKT